MEPTERGNIPAHPKEFDTLQRKFAAHLLCVPDVLQDRSERSDADTRTDEDGDVPIREISGRGAVGTVDSNDRQFPTSEGEIDLDEVPTTNCVPFDFRASHRD